MVVGQVPLSTDVLVVGGGPAGYACAFALGEMGVPTILVEKAGLGGVCLHTGCIPSKVFLDAAGRLRAARALGAFGIEATVKGVDLPRLVRRKEDTVARLAGELSTLAKAHKVEVLRGEARFTGQETALVTGQDGTFAVRFRRAVVATGSEARLLPGERPDGERILLARHIFALREVPERLLVVGGGTIGVELGQALAAFGAEVVLVERAAEVLPMFDEEAGRFVGEVLEREGVDVRRNTEALAVLRRGDEVAVRVRRLGGQEEELVGSHVLVAVGRRPHVHQLGLEALGLEAGEEGLRVDERGRTASPHIYGAGDVTGGPMVAHRALAQGLAAAEDIAGRPGAFSADYLPLVLYSSPEVAQVGLTRAQALQEGREVAEVRLPLAALGRAVAQGEAEGFATLRVERGSRLLLGATVVAEAAGDLVGEIALALEMGATLDDLAFTHHPHPTFSETWREASLALLGLPLHLRPR